MPHSLHVPRFVLATANPHKVEEIRALLDDAGVAARIASLLDFPGLVLPEETGETLEENAVLKARAAADFASLTAVADDSGLEVDALGGQPGVHSKRFAGEFATDAERYGKLLTMMSDIPEGRRQARFRCCIAIVRPGDAPVVVEGVCRGVIGHRPFGSFGFGYDPVFIPEGMSVTMAQLPMAEKNTISHRSRALAAAIPVLRRLLAGPTARM